MDAPLISGAAAIGAAIIAAAYVAFWVRRRFWPPRRIVVNIMIPTPDRIQASYRLIRSGTGETVTLVKPIPSDDSRLEHIRSFFGDIERAVLASVRRTWETDKPMYYGFVGADHSSLRDEFAAHATSLTVAMRRD